MNPRVGCKHYPASRSKSGNQGSGGAEWRELVRRTRQGRGLSVTQR